MAEPEEPAVVDALALDLCATLACGPRAYSEVMEAWRTSCPRLDVWETVRERGWVVRRAGSAGPVVALSDAGRAALQAAGRTRESLQ